MWPALSHAIAGHTFTVGPLTKPLGNGASRVDRTACYVSGDSADDDALPCACVHVWSYGAYLLHAALARLLRHAQRVLSLCMCSVDASPLGHPNLAQLGCLGRTSNLVLLSSAGLHYKAPPPSKRATRWEAWVPSQTSCISNKAEQEVLLFGCTCTCECVRVRVLIS